jgi:ATP-dependent Clp protease protease subunit
MAADRFRLLSPVVAGASQQLRAVVRAPSGYKVVAAKSAAEATIYLYGLIGSSWFDEAISANQFRKDLTALGDVKTIHLRINSEGGDVFDGQAIYSLLTQHKARVIVHVDGLAASAASFVAMAGDEIEVAESAWMMIHDAWSIALGNAAEMRRVADLLESVSGSIADIYTARTKNKLADVKQWMAAETWWSGKECVEHGFADRTVENMKVAASVRDPAMFRHLPAALRPRRAAALAVISGMRAGAA